MFVRTVLAAVLLSLFNHTAFAKVILVNVTPKRHQAVDGPDVAIRLQFNGGIDAADGRANARGTYHSVRDKKRAARSISPGNRSLAALIWRWIVDGGGKNNTSWLPRHLLQ